MRAVLRRGVENGEISQEADLDLAADVLVVPVQARMASNITQDLDPVTTSRRIADQIWWPSSSRRPLSASLAASFSTT